MRSVLDMGHIPSGMEIFPAADVEQFEYIKKIIDECDYYVLIIGARYGSVDATGVSFTEKEYAYAVETKKVVLVFLHGDVGAIPTAKADSNPALVERLNEFRDRVASGRLVQFWNSRENLRAKVIIALHKAMAEFPQTGWIRGNAAASEDLLAQMNGLRTRLDTALSENQRLVSINKPKVDDLADLESSFTVRYKYHEWDSFKVETLNLVGSKDLTWREITRAVCPNLIQQRPSGIIGLSLIKFMKENKSVRRERMEVFDSDSDTIKLQLMALGYIEAYAADAKGGGVSEFISLSDRGRMAILEISAVRKPVTE